MKNPHTPKQLFLNLVHDLLNIMEDPKSNPQEKTDASKMLLNIGWGPPPTLADVTKELNKRGMQHLSNDQLLKLYELLK